MYFNYYVIKIFLINIYNKLCYLKSINMINIEESF